MILTEYKGAGVQMMPAWFKQRKQPPLPVYIDPQDVGPDLFEIVTGDVVGRLAEAEDLNGFDAPDQQD